MARKLDPTPAYVRPNSVHPDFVAGRQYTLVSPPRAIALGDPDLVPVRSGPSGDWSDMDTEDSSREEAAGSYEDVERAE